MKTAAIHIAALAACFTAHFMYSAELDGVRRALQTLATGEAQVQTVEIVSRAASVA